MLKLYSDIYPPEIKPVRAGRYMCRISENGMESLRLFNGQWCYPWGTFCPDQNWYWRGLAFDPRDAGAATEVVRNDGESSNRYITGVFIPGAEVE